MLGEDDNGILFVKDAGKELYSFNAIKKVQLITHDKGKDKLIFTYRDAI